MSGRSGSIDLSESCIGSTVAAHTGEWRASQVVQLNFEAVIVLCVVVVTIVVVVDVTAHSGMISTVQEL